ncbi:hypothetical protein FI667_g15207, partial [Globisporangium splendens]
MGRPPCVEREHFARIDKAPKKNRFFYECKFCARAHELDPDNVRPPVPVEQRRESLRRHLDHCKHYAAHRSPSVGQKRALDDALGETPRAGDRPIPDQRDYTFPRSTLLPSPVTVEPRRVDSESERRRAPDRSPPQISSKERERQPQQSRAQDQLDAAHLDMKKLETQRMTIENAKLELEKQRVELENANLEAKLEMEKRRMMLENLKLAADLGVITQEEFVAKARETLAI